MGIFDREDGKDSIYENIRKIASRRFKFPGKRDPPDEQNFHKVIGEDGIRVVPPADARLFMRYYRSSFRSSGAGTVPARRCRPRQATATSRSLEDKKMSQVALACSSVDAPPPAHNFADSFFLERRSVVGEFLTEDILKCVEGSFSCRSRPVSPFCSPKVVHRRSIFSTDLCYPTASLHGGSCDTESRQHCIDNDDVESDSLGASFQVNDEAIFIRRSSENASSLDRKIASKSCSTVATFQPDATISGASTLRGSASVFCSHELPIQYHDSWWTCAADHLDTSPVSSVVETAYFDNPLLACLPPYLDMSADVQVLDSLANISQIIDRMNTCMVNTPGSDTQL